MAVQELDADRLATMMHALAHPVRIEIVRMLAASGERQCMDLTRHVALAQSTVSEHLRVLKEAGLIRQCGPSARSGFCIDPEAMLLLKQMVVAL